MAYLLVFSEGGNLDTSPDRDNLAAPTTETNTGTRSSAADWVAQHGDILFRYAWRRVSDRTVAEELVQETFLAALQAQARFRADSTEQTWLLGILKHKILDHYRKSRNQQPLETLAESDPAVDTAFDRHGHWRQPPAKGDVNPDAMLGQQDFMGVFQDCLKALPPQLLPGLKMAGFWDAPEPQNWGLG